MQEKERLMEEELQRQEQELKDNAEQKALQEKGWSVAAWCTG